MSMAALQSLGKLDDPMFGTVSPDETVDLYFNLSKDDTQEETRGSWNKGDNIEYLADPEPQGETPDSPTNSDDERSTPGAKSILSTRRSKKAKQPAR